MSTLSEIYQNLYNLEAIIKNELNHRLQLETPWLEIVSSVIEQSSRIYFAVQLKSSPFVINSSLEMSDEFKYAMKNVFEKEIYRSLDM